MKNLFLTIMFVFYAVSANATTWHVNSTASGSNNGTSWGNAWSNLNGINWTGLSAGDIVCVAGGSYSGSITTGKSGISGNPITVRRATTGDSVCGSNTTGWNTSFDSQVAMTGNININNSYITIDGAVSNGILVTMQNPSGSVYVGICLCGGPTTGVVVKYVEVSGPCGTSACSQNNDQRSMVLEHWNGSNWDSNTNTLVQYTNFHGACNNMVIYGSVNLVVEHSRMADSATTNTANCHPNIVNAGSDTNTTWRYNEMVNWQVEGIMLLKNSGTWNIYGNIWHDPMAGSYPRVVESQESANVAILYNNTFVNLYYICASTSNAGTFGSGSQGMNNLYYGNNFSKCGLPTEDYDYSDKALTGETHGQGSAPNIFVSLSSHNYYVTGHTNSGITLPSPYDLDFVGNSRGTGVWDRGAYAYVPGVTGNSPPSSPVLISIQ